MAPFSSSATKRVLTLIWSVTSLCPRSDPPKLFYISEKSGPYYITFYNCDPSVDIRVKGTMFFRNPYGWLYGEDWPSAAVRLSTCLRSPQ